MKAKLDCIPCLVRQALNAARLSTNDPAKHALALDEAMRVLQGVSLDQAPATMSRTVYDAVRDVTGVADPFKELKAEMNRRALALIPEMRKQIAAAPDPLFAALKCALAGNIIDFGVIKPFDMERDVAAIIKSGLDVNDYDQFVKMLAPGKKLLYICDNAGEIAFDCLLVEKLKGLCDVTACVKSGPIINDATREDAEAVGLNRLVPLIETGSDDVGVNWARASEEFKSAFTRADIILTKGQGNFETLHGRPEEIFFLLRMKCPEIAAEIKRGVGESVFLRGRGGS